MPAPGSRADAMPQCPANRAGGEAESSGLASGPAWGRSRGLVAASRTEQIEEAVHAVTKCMMPSAVGLGAEHVGNRIDVRERGPDDAPVSQATIIPAGVANHPAERGVRFEMHAWAIMSKVGRVKARPTAPLCRPDHALSSGAWQKSSRECLFASFVCFCK